MRLDRRNYPPEHAIRVPYDALRGLVEELFLAANMAEADAELLAPEAPAQDLLHAERALVHAAHQHFGQKRAHAALHEARGGLPPREPRHQ